MSTATVFICLLANMATCDGANALHSWNLDMSSRACGLFASSIQRLDGDIGEHLNGVIQYKMQPNERVKVICKSAAQP